jgi:Carboxypeptidase regulatory-like domain/TonB-dependent Receptor Plug Domain
MRKALLLALALVVAATPGLLAQISTGNLYGTVADESGAVLPGAAVTLTSEFGTRTSTSGGQGEFRFLNLERGRYKVTTSLAGFTSVSREVSVVTGENVNIAFTMKVAAQAETVTVTGEAALVDIKKRGTATTLTTEELKDVPNPRDPWGVMRAVPGVLVDRVNIAGNENGQQAAVAGKGSTSSDKTWNLDGMNITDMSATGASPTYFDFGAFQEITVTTGGTDLSMQTGGLGINLTTKRGTNKFHGGGRGFLANHKMSSNNVPDNLKNDPRLKGSGQADHLAQVSDYGFDLGGPIVKDKLWFYGTYGKQDIRNVRLTQTPDKTLLPSYNMKLNWQATQNTMASAFYFVGKKQKFGRGVGFPVNETDDFLWNQDNAYVDGGLPGGLWKAQVDHTFSPNFFVSAKAAYYDTGFGLTPRGGEDKTYTVDYVATEAIGSYYHYVAIRPQKTINLDGNYFFTGMGGNNELKFGFGFRKNSTHSSSHYGGDQLAGIINSPTDKVAYVWRDGITDYTGKYWSGYLGDTFTKNRFTMNVGARYDHQAARNLPGGAPGNASFPNVVPAITYNGSDDIIKWSTISPRAGLSYALDASRKTVLRASYANYAEQLAFGNVAGSTGENPIASGYLAYEWIDRNNDRFVQPNEVNLGNFLYSHNIDPANPTALSSPNKIDRNLKPKRDHEFIVGIDRELGANFAAGIAYTWRRGYDWEYVPRLGAPCPTATSCRIITPADYTANPPSSANGFTANTTSPNSALVTAGAGGRYRTNAPGYHTIFSGGELTMVKRLSHRWMGRVAASFNNWTEHWDGTPYGVLGTNASNGSTTRQETSALVQGGQVALLSGGSGKASFYTSVKWQIYANGMVQLPVGFDLSAGVFGKQGGSYPITLRLGAGRDGNIQALATSEVDSVRYPNVWDLDLRLAKNIRFGGGGITASAELFNALNNNVVLGRARQAGTASGSTSTFTSTIAGAEPGLGRIEEILSPRVFRLGLTLTF